MPQTASEIGTSTGSAARSGNRLRPVLVLVHGTGDTSGLKAITAEPERWWQADSRFDKWLFQRLEPIAKESRPRSDLVVRFVWSGLNSEKAREEAAASLAFRLGRLGRAGRSIHILAHSHGGNVVRRAMEIGEIRRKDFHRSIRSITTFGVPFFHYSFMRTLSSLLANLGIFGALVTYILFISHNILSADNPYGQWIQLVAVCFALFYFLNSISVMAHMSVRRLLILRRLEQSVLWKNFYSAKDEAISLLMSTNGRIRLVRRRSTERWVAGPLGCTAVVVLTLLALTLIVQLLATLVGVANASTWGQIGRGAAGVLAFSVGASLATWGVDYSLDAAITSKLRSLAYGDDLGNGMIRVERYPWPHAEHCAVQISPALEEAMESYVAEQSSGLWAAVRAELTPSLPLLAHDFNGVVNAALTGNELAHTVYYHVEAFADLVAATLADTGEWRFTRPRPDG